MSGYSKIDLRPETESRFQSFIIFEASASRVNPSDIYMQGVQVKEFFDTLYEKLAYPSNLKEITIFNRLQKIRQMLELLSSYDNIIISKFFDRIWRRYSYVSNLGEQLIDYETFKKIFPDMAAETETVLAPRIDTDEDDEDDSGSDDDDDTAKETPKDSADDEEEEEDTDEDDNGTGKKKTRRKKKED